MTKSVRYYIEKETDDQAVVRSVPVAVPRYVTPDARGGASPLPADAAGPSGRRAPRRAAGRARVARLVRAAIHRDGEDR